MILGFYGSDNSMIWMYVNVFYGKHSFFKAKT